MTEHDNIQNQILSYIKLLNNRLTAEHGCDMIKYYHTYDSRRCVAGEPDLKIMVAKKYKYGNDCKITHFYVEIKTIKSPKLTPEQREFQKWIENANDYYVKHAIVFSLEEFIKKTNNLGYPEFKMEVQ